MSSFLTLIAKVVKHEAYVGAGSASIKGTYETKVPEQLLSPKK